MPRSILMTWNRKAKRWFKKANGKQYAVSCKALAKTYPDLYRGDTEEGSCNAANRWWQDHQNETAEQCEAAVYKKIDEIFQDYWATQPARPTAIQEIVQQMRDGTISPVEALRQIEEVDISPTNDNSETVGKCLGLFVDNMETRIGRITAGRFDAARRSASVFANFVGQSKAINQINGAILSQYHAKLMDAIRNKRMSQPYARDNLAGAKQFLNWCYENDLLENLPRNFRSASLQIAVQVKEVETIPIDEIKSLLAKATPKTKLYILLMLNCGMTGKDISDLRHKEIDFPAGTICRKRSKTIKHEGVPTVVYRLWPETARLLKEHLDHTTERALLTRDGKRLVRQDLCEGKIKLCDCIRQAWSYLNPSKPPKHLRKTSATLLGSNKLYAGVAGLFLGHSPKSIADRHYVAPAQETLFEGLAWLGSIYGVN
jgi:integrase